MIDDGWVDQLRKKGEEMVGDIFSLDVFFFFSRSNQNEITLPASRPRRENRIVRQTHQRKKKILCVVYITYNRDTVHSAGRSG